MPLVRVTCRQVCRTIAIPPPYGSDAGPVAAESCKESCGSRMTVDTGMLTAFDLLNAIAPTYYTFVNGKRVARTVNPIVRFERQEKKE